MEVDCLHGASQKSEMYAPASTTALLELYGEEIGYQDIVTLSEISLRIFRGDKVALLGRSGAGKTTLLRKLFSIQPRSCAFVHQSGALVPQLSVFHNIYMGKIDHFGLFTNVRNLIRPSKSKLDEIRAIATSLELEDKLFAKVGALSGGQQQRVGIGRAIYHGGSILLADEPVSSLDVFQQEKVMKMLVTSGETVITALHSLDLARCFCNRIIALKDGRILFDLPVPSVTDPLLAELYD